MFVVGGGCSVDDAVVLFDLFFKAKGYFSMACAQILIFTLYVSFLILCFVFRETCWFTPVSENIDCIYKYIYHSSLLVSLAFDMIILHLARVLTISFDRLFLDPFHFCSKEQKKDEK